MKTYKSNNLLTIISLSLVLFLLGLYMLVSTQSTRITEQLKEKINIVVELANTTTQSEKTSLIDELKQREEVIPESIQYLSKEEAKEMMIGDDEQLFLSDSLANPFDDAIVLNLNAEYYNEDVLSTFSEELKSQSIIQDVFYQEDLFKLIDANLRKVGNILLIGGLLILALAIALIFNTVNLSLLTDKKKIETMELVGAERDYIKRPYLRKAFITGFISFILATILLILSLLFILYGVPFLSRGISYVHIGIVFFILLALSVGIPLLSTNNIVNKYLNNI